LCAPNDLMWRNEIRDGDSPGDEEVENSPLEIFDYFRSTGQRDTVGDKVRSHR